jgi:cytochrome c peroxidase
MVARITAGAAVALILVAAWVSSPVAAQDARQPLPRRLRLPDTPFRYANPVLPDHFTTFAAARMDNTPPDNPLTDAGAALGRVLFYDTRLSANGTVSCGSCHLQAHAFADPNRFSKGFAGQLTDRHAMTIVDLRYYQAGRFFWDERAGNLEEMVLLPIENRIEMGQQLKTVVGILARDARYAELFRRAFGDHEVTERRIGQAMAQFIRSMVSYRSKYDNGRTQVQSAHDDFENFTVQENRGKALFLRNCANCHLPVQDAHFFMPVPTNNGVDADYRHADGGVGEVTLRGHQLGSFKSPTLRNVEVTGPYMHDGRFATLGEVVDHYSEKFNAHPNLDLRMRPLNFTPSEKASLIAFLETLTDRAFLSDPKFSNPWSE